MLIVFNHCEDAGEEKKKENFEEVRECFISMKRDLDNLRILREKVSEK